ncbi:hypothetical protein CAPTEDRAFT_189905 [Capitella teleta]|uniref:Glycosyl hydrolase family 88 n=1 Tax=Capitella teleta TaxID=283909 RepID=R7VFJ7_CAPTE|nr:hypothetical protein CAPTEDRAFT_189905 [Capitella teleta]|eukprot:ELU17342.1 hypothetical protein CAPTEDRAFT_189905 [Capitella teleta]
MAGRFGLLLTIVVAATSNGRAVPTPKDYALRVIDKILEVESQAKGVFLSWDYGGGIIFDAMHRASTSLGHPELLITLDKYLDDMTSDPDSYGYKILHNIRIPFYRAVGDQVPLFTIAYLNRYLRQRNASDLMIVNTAAQKYLLPYPYYLADGTFSRHEGWGTEPDRNASFVWADDQYMALTLLCRIAKAFDRVDYANLAVKFAGQYAGYLFDTTDGLSFHGYNDADHKNAPCKWGRANGWGMMTHVEILEAMDHFPALRESESFKRQLRLLQQHSAGLRHVQSKPDGRWHQVIDEASTFLETSATAMFVSSMIRAVKKGWLDRDYVGPVIFGAWEGLRKTIGEDGRVDGISCGTGIGTNASFYNGQSTEYVISQPGLGSVIHALVDLNDLFESSE